MTEYKDKNNKNIINNRIEWLDFGKGFTIFSVVIYHAIMLMYPYGFLNIIKQICSVFMMPVFFAISGYLYKNVRSKSNFFKLVYKKSTSFIIPYSIFVIVVFYFYKYKLVGSHPISISSIFFVSTFNYLWFLYILFIVFLLCSSINYFLFCKNNFFRLFLIVLDAILLIAVYPFGITNFILWLSAFLLGILAKYYNIVKMKINIQIVIIISWVLLLLCCSIFRNKYYLIFKNILSIFSPVIFFIIFYYMSLFFKHTFIFKHFCRCGKYTLFIYLIHFPIMILIIKEILLYGFSINTPIYSIVMGVSVYLLCIVLCKLILHVKFLYYIFYPRSIFNAVIQKFYNKSL